MLDAWLGVDGSEVGWSERAICGAGRSDGRGTARAAKRYGSDPTDEGRRSYEGRVAERSGHPTPGVRRQREGVDGGDGATSPLRLPPAGCSRQRGRWAAPPLSGDCGELQRRWRASTGRACLGEPILGLKRGRGSMETAGGIRECLGHLVAEGVTDGERVQSVAATRSGDRGAYNGGGRFGRGAPRRAGHREAAWSAVRDGADASQVITWPKKPTNAISTPRSYFGKKQSKIGGGERKIGLRGSPVQGGAATELRAKRLQLEAQGDSLEE